MNSDRTTITEAAQEVPVIAETDVCVLGGSCTGVFAAVRAARLGRSVVLVEKTNAFGGVATNGLVCAWHSFYDTRFERQIIGGLSADTAERLEKRGALIRLEKNPHMGCRFNSEELKIELDEVVLANGVRPMLHTSFCAPVLENGSVDAVLVENKDGRGAIRAGVFVDATGDGDLVAQCGLPFAVDARLQAPTTCAKIRNFPAKDFNYRELYSKHHREFGLEADSGWDCGIPGLPGLRMVAQTHVYGADCSDADPLTQAEITGRRQIRAIMDMIRKYGPAGTNISLAALPAYIGIRETRRFEAEYELKEDDVLWGRRFEDAVAQGSYRVDVHHPEGGGFLFKYLDGTMSDHTAAGSTRGRWRDPIEEDPTFYQVPYRTMVHRDVKNVIMAGRMISADRGAFGAIRVMVNLNQTGEAAGVAASLALQNGIHVKDVDPAVLRKSLVDGGSILL